MSEPAVAASPSAAPASIQVTPMGGSQGGAPAVPAPAPVNDWTSGLNDDTRGYVANKGFKDPGMVLESYRNLEKLIGAPRERLLKLPENMEDPQGMNEIYSKLGRPETPEGYKIEVPKEGGDPEFAKWAGGAFHELGLSTKQANTLVNKWGEYVKEAVTRSDQTRQQENLQMEEGLKKKWGAAYDQNVKVAKSAMREFNIPLETIEKMESAMGFSQVMELLHNVGSKVGEPAFHTGNPSAPSVMMPEAARNRIASLRADNDFTKRYLAGDVGAKAEMDRLHRMAYID